MAFAKWELPENIEPGVVSIARTITTVEASTKVELNSETTFITVTAVAKDVFLKWADSDEDYVTSENFDALIPSGTTLYFLVPVKENGVKFSKIQLVGRESGATASVTEK